MALFLVIGHTRTMLVYNLPVPIPLRHNQRAHSDNYKSFCQTELIQGYCYSYILVLRAHSGNYKSFCHYNLIQGYSLVLRAQSGNYKSFCQTKFIQGTCS